MAFDYADERLRINALRKNTILPKELQVQCSISTQSATFLSVVELSCLLNFNIIIIFCDHYGRWFMKTNIQCDSKLFKIQINTEHLLQEVADKEIAALPRDSCPVRIRNRCVMTSRPRGVKKRWRLSRIVFRHLADHNQMSGILRARWWFIGHYSRIGSWKNRLFLWLLSEEQDISIQYRLVFAF